MEAAAKAREPRVLVSQQLHTRELLVQAPKQKKWKHNSSSADPRQRQEGLEGPHHVQTPVLVWDEVLA